MHILLNQIVHWITHNETITGVNTFVLGYQRYTKNANFASLYIGILQFKEIRFSMSNVWQATKEDTSNQFELPYHEMKLSPTLSKTVKAATKILQTDNPPKKTNF